MIGRDELAEACRQNDAVADERADMVEFFNDLGVDITGLLYVAEQRALRGAMVLDGRDPRDLPTDEETPVSLPPHIRELMPALMGLFFDGLAVGMRVKGPVDE